MDPTWTQVGSNLPQAGSMLDTSWFQLGSSWTHIGPRSGSPAAPGPTPALPIPFLVASARRKPPFVLYNAQHRSRKGFKMSNFDLHNPQLGAQTIATWLQKAPSQVPNLTVQFLLLCKFPDLRFPMNLCFSGAWNASILVNFWNKFR